MQKELPWTQNATPTKPFPYHKQLFPWSLHGILSYTFFWLHNYEWRFWENLVGRKSLFLVQHKMPLPTKLDKNTTSGTFKAEICQKAQRKFCPKRRLGSSKNLWDKCNPSCQTHRKHLDFGNVLLQPDAPSFHLAHRFQKVSELRNLCEWISVLWQDFQNIFVHIERIEHWPRFQVSAHWSWKGHDLWHTTPPSKTRTLSLISWDRTPTEKEKLRPHKLKKTCCSCFSLFAGSETSLFERGQLMIWSRASTCELGNCFKQAINILTEEAKMVKIQSQNPVFFSHKIWKKYNIYPQI